MSNSIITWTDEQGSGIRGLPKKVGQARFHRCLTEADLPGDGDPGDLALVEDGAGGRPYVRMESGWHRAREVQVTNETDEHEDLRTMDGSIVRVLEPTVRVSIQVAGLENEPVTVPLAYPIVGHEGPVEEGDDGLRCLACGAETMDRELFDELGCSVR